MPNWCSNHLTVTGDDESLGEIYASMERSHEHGWFREVVPCGCPQDDEGFCTSDWYTNHIRVWGTKWDVRDGQCDYDPELCVVLFDTAWAPPVQFIYKLSEKFPVCEFIMSFQEEGMCFQGVMKAKAGEYLLLDSELPDLDRPEDQSDIDWYSDYMDLCHDNLVKIEEQVVMRFADGERGEACVGDC